MKSYLLPAAFLLLSIVFGIFAGTIFHLSGSPLLFLRVALVLMGAAAAFLLYRFSPRRSQIGAAPATSGPEPERQILLRAASQRLRSAQRPGVNTLSSMPMLYVLGAPNSGKTTTISKCGMEPDLLAGQVYQDGVVVATKQMNLWYADGNIFLDAGESLSRDASAWSALIRDTSPGLIASMTHRLRPLRAAVVCISSEAFFGPGSDERLTELARETNAALRVMTRQLGADLPVHVVLTKTDRIVGFAEYVQHLTHEEACERMGVDFPMENQAGGVYADRTAAMVSSSLDCLFFSLGEFRLEILGRETQSPGVAGIYQFPRELQKLRGRLTNYMVELTRPSQLNASPALRSFSLVGVRARLYEKAVMVPAESQSATFADSDATGIFSLRQAQGIEQPVRAGATRTTAQWCFLPKLFSGVFLSKDEQQHAAAASPRVRLLRRAALAAAASVALLWTIGLTVSYFNNASLERNIREAAKLLPPDGATVDLANLQQLADLDRLRIALIQLREFDRDGAPWRYRWGLYRGHALLESTRDLYFQRFRWVLLDSTQSRIRTSLSSLPATAPASADYLAAYNPLRAYLITTSYPQFSSGDFLENVLTPAWAAGRLSSEDQRAQLASEQFHFFGDELRIESVYNIAPSTTAVKGGRAYLNSFGSFDRVYQNMLAAAERSSPAIDFNRLYPGSSATVVESHIVPGAFSRKGFSFMEAAIRNPERFFTGEPWVLGDQTQQSSSANDLTPKLTSRYNADFSSQWVNYLHSASVVRFHGLSDAGQKLGKLSSPSSALLALIFTASQNTSVSEAPIAHQFQPTQALVPPNLVSRLIAPSNSAYINGLVSLQGAVSQLAQDPTAAGNPASAQGVISAAANAHGAVSQTSQSFDVDPQAHVEQLVTKLLQEPIDSVEEAVRGAAPAEINAAGRQFCTAAAPVMSKYPLDRTSNVEATPAEIAAILQPGTGALWQFYLNSLKPVIVQQGSQWVASPGAAVKPTPQFLAMFNRLAGFSTKLFPAEATAPELQFNAHILRSPDIESVTLQVDGQKASGADVTHAFHWSSQSAQQAQLIASYGTNNLPLQFNGPWALFHLVDRGHVEQSSNPLRLSYPLQISGTPIMVNGTALTERIELSGADILNPDARTGLRCTAQVAR
ncbi:ImcF-related family protein [Silvibacterium acidisoli]|uniref:ImcF-related family protein n=1 Tax=Acidobacteriaceae bacterium ZG23-2 TaxID=2883246 RepID=UPI00406C0517